MPRKNADHRTDTKFDPFSQREFYQLFAYFNNVPEKGRAVKFGNSPPYIKAPTREQQKQLKAIDLQVKDAERAWTQIQAKVVETEAKWESTIHPANLNDWLPTHGLLKQWTLNKTDTPLVKDGNSAFASGRTKSSLVFDGKRYVDAGDVGHFGFDDRFSFSVWVNPNKPPARFFREWRRKNRPKVMPLN